jgi:hypothetical protein
MLPIVILVALLAPYGCISFRYSESGTTESSSVKFAEKGAEILRLADERSGKRARDLEALPGDHPFVRRVQAVVDEVLALLPATATIGDKFWDEQEPFKYFARDRVRLVVVPSDAAVAEVYPNGVMYMTTGLIDTDFPYAAQTRVELVGLVAHELTHLHRGHVLRQWVMIEARQREVFKRVAAGLAFVLPGVSFKYEPGATYEEAAVYDRMIEYEADLGALEILEKLALEPGEYDRLLDRLAQHARQRRADARAHGWIEERATCLHQLFVPDGAKINVFRTVNDKREDKPAMLTPKERYTLCAIAHIHMSGSSAAAIAGWLEAPGGRSLDTILTTLPAGEVELLAPWATGVAWRQDWP